MANQNQKRVGFALVIILIGAVLLVDNLRLFDFYLPYYFRQWYFFIFCLGLFLLLVREKRSPGIVLIILSTLFFLKDVFDVSFFSLWPVLLIGTGVAILLKRIKSEPEVDRDLMEKGDKLDEFAAFSGPYKKVTSKNFMGGSISTVFAGMDVDLSDAELAGEKQVIDIFTIFGGSTIYVPPGWDVVVDVTPIFGGYADERHVVDPDDSGKRLIISGTVLFGGGEVKAKYPSMSNME